MTEIEVTCSRSIFNCLQLWFLFKLNVKTQGVQITTQIKNSKHHFFSKRVNIKGINNFPFSTRANTLRWYWCNFRQTYSHRVILEPVIAAGNELISMKQDHESVVRCTDCDCFTSLCPHIFWKMEQQPQTAGKTLITSSPTARSPYRCHSCKWYGDVTSRAILFLKNTF